MTALGGVIFCSHNILVLTTPCPPPPPPALDVSVPFLSLPSSPVHIPPHLNIMNFILELQNKEMNSKKIIAVKDSGLLGF